MTNTNKKNKNTRKLLGAIGMLTVSAAMLVSSTFAWFTMNKEVKATSMQVRAKAEQGLLINEVSAADSTTWDDEATAAQTAGTASLLYPASTADGSAWYTAGSKKSNDAAAATAGNKSGNLVDDYTALSSLTAITAMSQATATGNTTAIRETMGTSKTADAGYYVHYRYYLKSSAGAMTLGTTAGSKNIRIKSVAATEPTTKASENLNKSLRVGIFMKSSGTFYIYAPVSGYTASYYVAADDEATAPIAGSTATNTDLTALPASNADGTPVDVYLWYEGEDANCKSDNARALTLDNINVDITFELYDIPST
ncbi:MAG: hypothetical protein K6F27_12985 [Ruminococcus sp.]|nr:hypothetical protein [Ruminococcus sp.]